MWSEKRQIIFKPSINKKGHHRVSLKVDGKKTLFIHRLVAIGFIPNFDEKPQVDHIDQNKNNNCVENLRWVTNRENKQNWANIKIKALVLKGLIREEIDILHRFV